MNAATATISIANDIPVKNQRRTKPFVLEALVVW
jgi:hypothetical protein